MHVASLSCQGVLPHSDRTSPNRTRTGARLVEAVRFTARVLLFAVALYFYHHRHANLGLALTLLFPTCRWYNNLMDFLLSVASAKWIETA